MVRAMSTLFPHINNQQQHQQQHNTPTPIMIESNTDGSDLPQICRKYRLTWWVVGAVMALLVVLGWVFIIVMLILEEKWQLVLVAWLLLYSAAHFCYWYFKRWRPRPEMVAINGVVGSNGKKADCPPTYDDVMNTEAPPPAYCMVITEGEKPSSVSQLQCVPSLTRSSSTLSNDLSFPIIVDNRACEDNNNNNNNNTNSNNNNNNNNTNSNNNNNNNNTNSNNNNNNNTNSNNNDNNDNNNSNNSDNNNNNIKITSGGLLPSPPAYQTARHLRKISPRILPRVHSLRGPGNSAVTVTAAATAAAAAAAALTQIATPTTTTSPTTTTARTTTIAIVDDEEDNMIEDPIRGPIVRHLRSTAIATLDVCSTEGAIPPTNTTTMTPLDHIEDLQALPMSPFS